MFLFKFILVLYSWPLLKVQKLESNDDGSNYFNKVRSFSLVKSWKALVCTMNREKKIPQGGKGVCILAMNMWYQSSQMQFWVLHQIQKNIFPSYIWLISELKTKLFTVHTYIVLTFSVNWPSKRLKPEQGLYRFCILCS